MSAVTRLSVAVILLGFLIQGIEALRCYSCDSATQSKCNHHLKNDSKDTTLAQFETDCAAGQTCKILDNDHDHIWRGCADSCTPRASLKETEYELELITVCCNTNLCNLSPPLTPMTFVLVALTLAAITGMRLLS